MNNKILEDVLKNKEKELITDFFEIIDKHVEHEREIIQILIQEYIKAYETLIAQRKATINNLINIIAILFKDEKDSDVTKPTKSLMEKQQQDVDKYQQEMQLLVELQDALNNAQENNDVPMEIFDKIKNI